MGRKNKIKPEEVVETPAVEAPILNNAVFTEYPSMTELVVEAKVVEKEEPKAVTPATLESIEELALKVKKEVETLYAGLNVVYTKQFGKMIRILGNNGMHCFARVREVGKDSFLGEFLSFIPMQHLKAITAIFAKLGIANKNGTYLSTSGLV